MAPRVLVVGATSGVAERLAAEYAARGCALVLVARRTDALEAVAANLRIRHGATVETLRCDLADEASVDACALALAGGEPLDVLLFAAGDNGEGDTAASTAQVERITAVNYGAVARLLAPLLPALERRPGAAVAFIGSVAGDRGRKTNFVYGAAKAALHAYAQGLRGRLHAAGVSVTTVKLGYVDTRMAYGVAPAALSASPARAARSIHRAIERRREVVYVPGFWRLVMLAVRSIPESIFKRLSLP